MSVFTCRTSGAARAAGAPRVPPLDEPSRRPSHDCARPPPIARIAGTARRAAPRGPGMDAGATEAALASKLVTTPPATKSTYGGLFLIALATLMYEILLTRIF